MAQLQSNPPSSVEPPPFKKFLLYFLELGSLGFGGPIANVGYTQRDVKEPILDVAIGAIGLILHRARRCWR